MEDLSLGAAAHLRGLIYLFAVGAILNGATACSSQNPQLQRPPLFLFQERPFQINCEDRPAPLPPGTHSYLTFSPLAPYARTHLDRMQLPLSEFQSLTIAAELLNEVQIAGANQSDWAMQFCAMGEGNTVAEAEGYLRNVSLQRTGSLVTLNGTDPRGLTGGRGHLLVSAPARAPVTVYSDNAVEVHGMTGPVRISALGRATILNTSGLVDASAMIIDFASSQGSAFLNASWDIDVKATAVRFRGKLDANAQRQVHAIVPPGFQTPVKVVVHRAKDFVCRADFCRSFKKDREGSFYLFRYGDGAAAADRLVLRSQSGQVTLDTFP